MRFKCFGSEETEASSKIDRMIETDRRKLRKFVKLLLLGPGESGKSTIFKQMKIIQEDGGYSRDELMEYRAFVYSNCISQMEALLTASAKLNIELEKPENKQRAANILRRTIGNEPWLLLAEDIKHLWEDKGIKDTYAQKDKYFQLNDSASYFFENIDRYMKEDFIPNEQDVLRCRVRTTGIQESEFTFEKIRLKIVDVGGQRSQRRKWIHCFDCVTAVIFVAAMSDYDQVLREDETVNRTRESLALFKEIVNCDYFKDTPIVLFLNKKDLFKEKLKRVPLQSCFSEYTGPNKYKDAAMFIQSQYLAQGPSPRTIYTHATCAVDTENIKFVFKAVRQTILSQALEHF
ncbi:G-protein subunit alpha 4 [Heterostelium album PN500]|uniref:G-protein subunit alpha 4 n=1 Tax=Heterostelium pallidum (strain ATCC 26659 / Pp 5 / PN500) TaxID=670386 RepID=D3BCK8_HETP5|nr:G-protein subunit alpha 4 [Heterostelium album PN500]EFA80650.1 G-protein subunit alpha 4 [Heterostelium album PN500]|eukprot:XP_020432770.1 G-protein subunit alpha 4 [Heterostelium album PN500]